MPHPYFCRKLILLKVLILVRKGYKASFGGDVVQAIKTAQNLTKSGINVEIAESGESLSGRRFDILHFFNLGRPYDLYPYLSTLRVPLVVSTLFVDYFEYDVRGRAWPVRDFFAFLGKDHTEYVKAGAKILTGQIPWNSIDYLRDGHRKAVRRVVEHADCLIAATGSELERIFKYTQILPAYVDIVPLGIDPIFFTSDNPWYKRKGVISVGRLEGLKNQDRLIKAAEELDVDLTLTGKAGKNALLYKWYLKWLAGDKVSFTGHLPQENLFELYLMHKVHAQPSWFETTGLASLEAAASGCRIVVTNRGDTAEVFGVYALYCDPSSVKDISQNLLVALESNPAPEQREYFYENFSWEKTAQKIHTLYKKILDK